MKTFSFQGYYKESDILDTTLSSNLSAKSLVTVPLDNMQLEYFLRDSTEKQIWGRTWKAFDVKSKRQYMEINKTNTHKTNTFC